MVNSVQPMRQSNVPPSAGRLLHQMRTVPTGDALVPPPPGDPSQTGVKLTRFVHRPAGDGSRNTALVHSAVRERRSGMECFIQVRVDRAQLDVRRKGSELTQTNCTFCRAHPPPPSPDADRESMRALTSLISARRDLLLPQEWTSPSRLGRTRGGVQRLWRRKKKKMKIG